MSLDITELDTVSYPAWWTTSTTVDIFQTNVGPAIYSGPTVDVEFLPQGVSFPFQVTPWNVINRIVGTS